jgi:type IV pilus biogenesis protein CpaD/CtpE
MVMGMSLLAVLGLGLLSGCSSKDSQAAPETPEAQKQKDAAAAAKETGGKPEPATPPNVGQPGNSPK